MYQRRTTTTTHDQRGRTVAVVLLANHPTPARLLLTDFEALKAQGVSDQWTLNEAKPGHGYVRASSAEAGRHLVTIARLLLDAQQGRQIGYHDGDRTNLLRENLYLKGIERRARRAMPTAAKGASHE